MGGPVSEIEITVNGDRRMVPSGLDLPGLLAHLGLAPETVVVEHNRKIVRRAQLAGVPVASGDNVEIVHFVGGG
ncbi:MAG: bifunctional sulfur carrier protein/thiazole synthase protein [Gemmatimonadetes bacterium]|nr:bifunctional sulfur carrier protein/thiazole synthase protein [Gemmatimonadota bacterium]